MEETPNPASPERIIDHSEVIEALKAKGPDDPEVKQLVIKWTEQQESIIAEDFKANSRIIFELRRSEIYIAAGDPEYALECLQDALTQAVGEGEVELEQETRKKMFQL